MERYFKDNIVAIVTPNANGPIGIIRISGQESKQILEKIFIKRSKKTTKNIKSRQLCFGLLTTSIHDVFDEALAVYMKGPDTFTGEDVVEIFCHGNLCLLNSVIRKILSLKTEFKIRAAEPGEFSKRAYLNDKIDLTKAESICEIINAETEDALMLSIQNTHGKLRLYIEEIKVLLTEILAQIEVTFEFSEEDLQVIGEAKVKDILIKIVDRLTTLEQGYEQTVILERGINVAIVGDVNVGKSSLFNEILLEEKAIVTDAAGTTRDIVEGSLLLDGVKINVKDTAGLRCTDNPIEKIGIGKTNDLIKTVDIVLFVIDEPFSCEKVKQKIEEAMLSIDKTIIILNKADILFADADSGLIDPLAIKAYTDAMSDVVVVSARTRFGLNEVINKIKAQIRDKVSRTCMVHINQRQCLKIFEVKERLLKLLNGTQLSFECDREIIAEEIRISIDTLDEITGAITSDDVLGEIFSKFCVGK
ncbi:MAG: tRNA uridine-5-carboxymethylaminomethyl(34) synthesis GTPase MnmE [Deltaproteobacteria bacterium]|nr:tRNA uridine-5-carboxymethylaminomethyl(34) synthesis GTPase MnmE [Deltaproteobacteria bacterium]